MGTLRDLRTLAVVAIVAIPLCVTAWLWSQ